MKKIRVGWRDAIPSSGFTGVSASVPMLAAPIAPVPGSSPFLPEPSAGPISVWSCSSAFGLFSHWSIQFGSTAICQTLSKQALSFVDRAEWRGIIYFSTVKHFGKSPPPLSVESGIAQKAHLQSCRLIPQARVLIHERLYL